ncbi:MAG: efflux RND transporter periplasmic adaptor subunit [Desulfonatronovibrio sp.]
MSSDNFFENILENMADGVMALDFKGRIVMFNSSAGNILGMSPDKVRDDTFARIFMAGDTDNDEFNQVVLDAIYEQGIGLSSVVDFTRADGSKVSLSICSSYLEGNTKEQEKKGVILVFSDITEIKAMQARQEEDARKLGKAYRDMEEKNALLQQALRKVKAVRIASSVLILLLFFGIGTYYFYGDALINKIQSPASSEPSRDSADVEYLTVQQRPLTSSVSISGRLEPLEEIVVTSPFDGMIEQRNFSFGQLVDQGDLLILLDSSELEVKLRNARSEYIKINQKYQELQQWDSGTEMTKARRSLVRAKDTLEVNQRELEESELLFEKGIVAANEVDGKKRAVENALVDVKSAEEELESVRDKASEQNIQMVSMELENAKVNLETIEKQIQGKTVRAPVSGVVIKPVREEDKEVSLEKGSRISAGTTLFAVGDLSGVTVSTKIDEVDVRKVSIGQPVKARGDAFPGILLEGRVSHISAQAVTGSGQQAATFDVRITFPEQDEDNLEVIRVGMSADLEIVVYDNEKALMAPLSCVRVVQGRSMVRLAEPDGTIVEKEVKTGLTTLTSVEIKSGLKQGDRLVQW